MLKFLFLSEIPIFFRLNVLPFLLIFPFTLNPSLEKIKECWIPDEPIWPSNSTFAFVFDHVDVSRLEPYTFRVLLPVIVVFLEIILLLVPYWHLEIRCKLNYKITDPSRASYVAFFPRKYKGAPAIVKLIREEGKAPYTLFQHKKREWIDGHWQSLKYPNRLQISEYLKSNGLQEVEAAKRILYYGENSYTIPIPSFFELLIEQLRSPLFIFQVFSIMIYLLDEYFTTPLVSLISLIFLESTTVRTKQSNLLELRGVENPPIPLHVKRSGQWENKMSNVIVPGDLVVLDQESICPCDLIIISGRAVVNEANLTGESTPQIKDSCNNIPHDNTLNIQQHKTSVILAGSTIEQIIPSEEKNLPVPGVVCVVLSTGLGTSQGRLIRTIMYPSQVTEHTRDTYRLLLFLSFFAFAAGGYLAYAGSKNKDINTFRLIVEVILIFTATIPPDLPIQINFQINSSVLALSKLKVFCTEPYRLHKAGTATCCCFDKTGTLTAEEYRLIGVDNLHSPAAPLGAVIEGHYFSKRDDMPLQSLWVIGGCHSLIRGKYGQLIGDSLEASAFTSMKFSMKDKQVTNQNTSLKQLKIYHFSSELRRMTAVCKIERENNVYALMKGAPETIQELLLDVPDNYQETFRSYTRQGCRVLALAYREMTGVNESSFNIHTPRETVESNMIFAGFIIFSAAIKRGSEDTIAELLKTMHRVIIITGDDPLTACHAAKVLHISVNPFEIHDNQVTNENGEIIPEIDVLNNKNNNLNARDLVYTGRAIEGLSVKDYEYVVKHCNIFARMSPQQKANIIIKLNELGENTIMCGDGTNDVSALKLADAGLGLVQPTDDKENESNFESLKNEQLQEMGAQVNVGAASIASPFVTKRPTVSACIDLIRFGRSTLSSTLDMFKQLSLSSLINAYNMSFLIVRNVRMSEIQSIIFSVITSVSAFSIAWAIPRRKLSIERPFQSFFNWYLVSSVLFQFFTHFLFLTLTNKLVTDSGFKLTGFEYNARFHPNLLNTATYMMKIEMDIINICCNYRGAPFMQSFSENKTLLLGIILAFLLLALLMIQVHPKITTFLQLVPFPSKKFQITLAFYIIMDAVSCILFEMGCRWFFSRQQKERYNKLVSKKVVDNLHDYISNDDDILPEDSYNFGLMEMMKSNVTMQQNIREKNRKAEAIERKKKELQRQAENEVKANAQK